MNEDVNLTNNMNALLCLPIPMLAAQLGELLTQKQLRVTTAESCTGGQIATALCAAGDTPAFFGCGFVSFTDEAKSTLLHVKRETLARWTAVSEQTASEMVQGACAVSHEPVGIAVTGYAGPDGGEDGTPAGTVWFAWALPGQAPITALRHFAGDCESVIEQSVKYALATLITLLNR
ncbi:2-oxo-tetronate isomerase [Kosakonia sp. LAM2021]|uniref:2-oxo-tetronate isomerase n=2 Tax=Enterobacterales TaxID=91347 RepID=UPI00190D9713